MVAATGSKITTGHTFGLKHYKRRKFGVGHTAWLVFEEWAPDIIGRRCAIEELTDEEARLLIDRMKHLPDVPAEGQGSLF